MKFLKMLGQIFIAIGDLIFPGFEKIECKGCGSMQPRNIMEGNYCMDCII